MAAVSGKNLGLTASLINVIAPVISVVALIGLLVSLFDVISSAASYPSTTPNVGLLGGYLVLFIIVGIMSFIGVILFIVAMYQLSHYYNERGIFTNAITGLLVTIVGSILSYILAFAYLSSIADQFFGLGNFSSSSSAAASALMQFFIAIAVILVVVLVIAIISAIFYMRAFSKLAEKSEVHSFQTAGILYLIGTILTIIGIGVILIWIAWIFAASGFHALKPKPAPTYAYPPPPTQPTFAAPSKRCPYCGADNNPNAMYCRNCGKPI